MENLLCFFTTHIMIAYSAAQGKERTVKTMGIGFAAYPSAKAFTPWGEGAERSEADEG
jgi:hypothetical protein